MAVLKKKTNQTKNIKIATVSLILFHRAVRFINSLKSAEWIR